MNSWFPGSANALLAGDLGFPVTARQHSMTQSIFFQQLGLPADRVAADFPAKVSRPGSAGTEEAQPMILQARFDRDFPAERKTVVNQPVALPQGVNAPVCRSASDID